MSNQSRGTILWADDEIDFLKSHILYLEEKGYRVLAENSGEDAFDVFTRESVDLILLDEMMTGMDGIETLKKIKKIEPDIPIIMITKNEEEWLMEEAIASQISNYLIKPVNPTQIFIACKNILEKVEIRSEHISIKLSKMQRN
jgi:CheY-like chemotaxis protein